jgi:hypothetical protein
MHSILRSIDAPPGTPDPAQGSDNREVSLAHMQRETLACTRALGVPANAGLFAIPDGLL